MNKQLIRETVRAGMRRRVHLFGAMMSCISSDANFFHMRRPLSVSAPGLAIAPEK
jgi:hypothetical protein